MFCRSGPLTAMLRGLAVAAALALVAPASGNSQQSQETGPSSPLLEVLAQKSSTQTISPNDARALGLEAIRLNRPDIAAGIAQALIARDKADPFAHFLMATALMRMDRLPEAQKAGKTAFRYALTPEQHYQSARLTALAAYEQGRLNSAQWWLRRAAHHAPEEARKAQSVQEFAQVRAQNPLSYSFRFSVNPSDNVNNGSSGAFNIIDGVPFVGRLSADAQALSGVTAGAGVTLGYRLRKTATRETGIGLRADVARVSFSSKATAQLAGLPEPDLDTERLELSVRESWGPEGGTYRLSYGATVGRFWQSGVEPETYLRLNAGIATLVTQKTVLEFAATAEQRSKIANRAAGDKVYSLRGGFTHALPNAAQISGGVFVSRYQTSLMGRSSETLGASVSFAPGRDFGPLRMALHLGAQTSQYDGYTLAGIAVPGGRRDTTGYAEAEVLFPKIDFSGFAPSLSLRHQSTQSNVSRFKAKETSVTLGIKSLF